MKPKLTKKQLGKRYLELRESIKTSNFKTYTQDKLAKDLGITKTQISDLERGEKYISITELVSYAEYFNVTMEYLLGLSNNKYYNTFNKISGRDFPTASEIYKFFLLRLL